MSNGSNLLAGWQWDLWQMEPAPCFVRFLAYIAVSTMYDNFWQTDKKASDSLNDLVNSSTNQFMLLALSFRALL